MDPQLRKKHLAKNKKKDKGPVYASQKHCRIEVENLYRHEKNLKIKTTSIIKGNDNNS